MDGPEQTRERALSHKDYLETLHRPSAAEWRRISDVQREREITIDKKYHTAEEHEAATKIQKAYRGHRTRRQLEGLTLDPSSRWTEIMREWRYRSATVPHRSPSPSRPENGRVRAASDVAKLNWRRVGQIAEHAGGGQARSPRRESDDYLSVKGHADAVQEGETVDGMMLDMRYFLEMVDQKHRYGANLQVYHEEWLRSKANQNFFYWLDYGEGRHVDLPGCSREKLDKERIRYLSKDERLNYLTVVDEAGRLRWYKNNELITTSSEKFKDSMTGIVAKEDEEAVDFNDEEVSQQLSAGRQLARQLARAKSPDERRSSDSSNSIATSYYESESDSPEDNPKPVSKTKKKMKSMKVSPATILNKLLRATVKPGTWIYVSDTLGRLYVGIKASGAFQHASFLSGARISSAGSIGIENGQLTYLSPLSGHYRPTTKSFRLFIDALKTQGVDMSHVKVSRAFEVLLSMEYYGKSKKGVKSIFESKEREERKKKEKLTRTDGFGPASPELDAKFHMANDDYLDAGEVATDLVDRHWNREHKAHRERFKGERREHRSLGELMDDFRIRRRSFGGQKHT